MTPREDALELFDSLEPVDIDLAFHFKKGPA